MSHPPIPHSRSSSPPTPSSRSPLEHPSTSSSTRLPLVTSALVSRPSGQVFSAAQGDSSEEERLVMLPAREESSTSRSRDRMLSAPTLRASPSPARPELLARPSVESESSDDRSYGSTTSRISPELGREGVEVTVMLSPPGGGGVHSRAVSAPGARGKSAEGGTGLVTTTNPATGTGKGRSRAASTTTRAVPASASAALTTTTTTAAALLPSALPAPAPTSSKRLDPILPSSLVPVALSTAMYWSKTPLAGRIPRGMRAHTAVLVGSDIWCFGGCDRGGNCFRDVWKLDCDTFVWSKPRVVGDVPPVTRAHTCTVVGDRLFVFGGGDGPNYYNETYYLDTISLTWTKPPISGTAPSRRRAQTAVLYESKILIFGGGNGSQALNDVHALDISDLDSMEWTQLSVGGRAPLGRGYHSASIVGTKCLVFGGSDGSECFSDVSILDLEILEWIHIPRVEESLTIPRLSHTSTQVGSYLFIIGGHDGVNFSNEVLLFNLVSLQWELRSPAGLPPSPRGYHQTILHDSRLLVIGGFNGQTTFDEVWTLDLGGSAFLPLITQFEVVVQSEEEEEEES